MRLLIIEDDRDAADYWSRHSARSVMSPINRRRRRRLQLALDGEYDVLIVDRMLPKRDGLSVIVRCGPSRWRLRS